MVSMASTQELGSESDAGLASFSFPGEDHTLGNSLRFVLNKDPRVAFCGYSVPHASENRVNVRVQTTGDPAKEVVKDALQDLIVMCEHVTNTFNKAVDEHRATQGMSGVSTKSGLTNLT